MGIITYVLLAHALANVINCAPTGEHSAKPPAVGLSTTTTANPEYHLAGLKRQAPILRDYPSSSSEESKESGESTEATKPRSTRDSESNANQQTRESPEDVVQTPKPVIKDYASPELPARETRETNEQVAAPAVVSVENGSSTSSTPTSTTAARSYN